MNANAREKRTMREKNRISNMKTAKKTIVCCVLLIIVSSLLTTVSWASDLDIGLDAGAGGDGGTLGNIVETLFGADTQTVDIVILLTILTLLPSILMMFTSFTRIMIILSFMRNALGMQQTPPNQVLIGLALMLTLFVMSPVVGEIYTNAYEPYTNDLISREELIDNALTPLREFMLRQVHKSDIDFFINMSGVEYESYEQVPTTTLLPAFILSEIKIAFQIGFFIYIPFLVIDMVVASTLMAMGMMMLPPAMISLPFKVLIFVLVDGWQLVVGTIVQSIR